MNRDRFTQMSVRDDNRTIFFPGIQPSTAFSAALRETGFAAFTKTVFPYCALRPDLSDH
jgi:hypothetical protein